jgi:PLP dependent protein
MQSIADNIRTIREHLADCAAEFSRPADSITLLAVSKTRPASDVLEAHRCGVQHFGENYLQEALPKIEAVAMKEVTWHFIGPIQSNKTRDIAEHFSWVHSVDRLRVATRLNEQRPPSLPPLNVLVQVNISGEDSKSGIALPEAAALCSAIDALPRLRLRGLMAIPAPCSDFAGQRRTYTPLAAVFRELSYRYPWFDTLSIGMSDDFRAAIAEGSTMVRIGTAIFGRRQ